MTPEIEQIIEAQGWTADSVLVLLWSYVEAQQQPDAVLDHFRQEAARENQNLGPDNPQLSLLKQSERKAWFDESGRLIGIGSEANIRKLDLSEGDVD